MILSLIRYCLLFPISFSLLIAEPGKSQQRTIDSLERLLANPTSDTQRVNRLIILSRKLAPSDSYKAFGYAMEALTISRKKSYKKGEMVALHNLGSSQYFRNSYDSALLFYDSALVCAAALSDSMEMNRILNNTGQAYYYRGNYPQAMEYYYQALKICEKINHAEGIGTAMRNIGQLHSAQGQMDKAAEYYEKTRALREKLGDKEGLAQILADLGNIFAYQQKFSDALEYYKRAMKIMEELNHLHGMASIANNIGGMYGEMGDYEQSIKFFQKSLDIYTRAGDSAGAGSALSNIGLVYMLKGDHKNALHYCLLALQSATKSGHRRLIKNTYRDIAKIYRSLGDYRNAFDYYVKYASVKDSLLNEESTKQMAEMQTKYDTEKKEKEIAILNKDKKIRESELSRQRMIIVTAITGIILLAGFLAVLFNRFYIIRKQKRLIEKQKRMVEEAHRQVQQKNRDILDSIEYAKRIQVALLTGREYFNQHLPEYFLIYRPKDVVSGDFYWGLESGKYFYLVLADCTGHGVPGAFMSLLGISFLNEIIIEKKINSPEAVLNELRSGIIHSLNPEGMEDIQDGMDMVLCRFDFENCSIDFAGANSGLWIVRSGELNEYNGDDMPIGAGLNATTPFSLKTVPVQENDIIYMFTDGFRDQHGGVKNKKMGRKGLRELILKSAILPMNTQGKVLEEAFEKWKGINEQTDDVTVIGIRI